MPDNPNNIDVEISKQWAEALYEELRNPLDLETAGLRWKGLAMSFEEYNPAPIEAGEWVRPFRGSGVPSSAIYNVVLTHKDKAVAVAIVDDEIVVYEDTRDNMVPAPAPTE